MKRLILSMGLSISVLSMELLASEPKFLEYIYMIRPDHKKKGYSINKERLQGGYAYGEGPYDGWKVEFFLYEGKSKDLVFEQLSGPEVAHDEKFYGFVLRPYYFKGNKKHPASLNDVFPLKAIEQNFEAKIGEMRKNQKFKGWKHYKLINFQKGGSVIKLQICKDFEDPPYDQKSECALLGELVWGREGFKLRKSMDLKIEIVSL